jgi:hypothetical protein
MPFGPSLFSEIARCQVSVTCHDLGCALREEDPL